MVAIPPKPPTKTSHNTTPNGQGCRTRPTQPHKGPTCAQTGHHSPINPHHHATPRLKRRQWARSSPQHTRKKDMPNPPPRRKRLTANRRAQNVVHYTPNTPCHPDFTEVDCTLSKHSGGFATIDPRHADDTPQRSAYGSNSPQATNKDKPQRHQRHTTRHHTTSHHSKPKPPLPHQPNHHTTSHHMGTQPRNHAQAEHRAGIAKGAGVSRPLARVPSLIHEGHLDATHQRGDDVVEHGSQR